MAQSIIKGVERRPIAELKPYHGNPKLGDIEAITQSMESNGIFNVLGIDPRTNEVLYGSHRLHALHESGQKDAWCVLLDVRDDEHAKRINYADNRLSDVGTYDQSLLLEGLQSLPDLIGTGYDDKFLQELVNSVNGKNGLTDADEVPEPPKETVSKTGDLWLLGKHRVLCGDARKAEDYERLGKADMVITDPPYGVGIGAKNRALQTFDKAGRRTEDLGDDQDINTVRKLWSEAFPVLRQQLRPGTPWYCCGPQGGDLSLLLLLLQQSGLPARHMLIWVKNRPAFSMGRLDYQYQHEPIAYGWVEGAAHPWFAGDPQRSILEYDRPQASPDHATTKPVGLFAHLIRNSAQIGGVVLDPFLGSGTTVIACEQEGRICYGMEIEPRYVDVICKRYQEFTGNPPILERTGESHDFTTG